MTASETGVGRAEGKLILLGEHAVVYGHPAIAMGLGRGAVATARPARSWTLALGDRRHEPDGSGEVSRAFRALVNDLGAPPASIEAHLEIFPGAGLGASAAIGVAVARAIRQLVKGSGARDEAAVVARAAAAWENVLHGRASGVDAAAAQHGGCLSFTRERGVSRLKVARPIRVVVARVAAGCSTRIMVEAVARAHHRDVQRVETAFVEMASLARRAERILVAGDASQLGPLMVRSQELLVELGVSTPALDRACLTALDAGATGAKLTGAGGGGCVIAVAPDSQLQAVQQAWELEGYDCFVARAGSSSAPAGGRARHGSS